MNILLISGSYPPEPCGVGDYTGQLSQALQSEGLNTHLLRHNRWRMCDIPSLLPKIDKLGPDIIHVQYPSIGYGRYLGPQILSLNRPCIVTIHEVSQAHVLRKLSLYGFYLAAQKLIFTTSFEQATAVRYAPWISSRSVVIPIGSNIPVVATREGYTSETIGYFGLIRPQKGLEQIIELARMVAVRGLRFKILIIGSVPEQHRDYYNSFRQRSLGLPIEWRVGLEGKELDAAMAEPQIAYLPFPDGASERRSSLLAFLSRGTPVITTTGRHVSEELKSVVRFAPDPSNALLLAESLANDRELWNELREKGTNYARMFSWERIAQRHVRLYDTLLHAANLK